MESVVFVLLWNSVGLLKNLNCVGDCVFCRCMLVNWVKVVIGC